MARPRLPVRRPHERIRRNVRNRSSRHGARPRGIVIHTTESHNRDGLGDLQGVVGWFDNPAAQASSHVIIDAEGQSARCVPDADKAWTCAAFNPWTLNVELVGHAADTPGAWDDRRPQIEKAAKYLAYWSKRYRIPLELGAVAHGQIVRPGILTHAELGAAGGGHHDPGAAFPMDELLRAARYYARRGWPH